MNSTKLTPRLEEARKSLVKILIASSSNITEINAKDKIEEMERLRKAIHIIEGTPEPEWKEFK